MKNKILIASNNPGKITEIRQILAAVPLELITPFEIDLNLTVLEDGNTYYENAFKKAKAFYERSGLPTLADDSGLEVDALGSAPGINSHRFASDLHTSDFDRCEYLLGRLQGFPQPWSAAFHCEIVLYIYSDWIIQAHGTCLGTIIPEPRGNNGFGYDPIFLLDEYPGTMAELPDALKNKLSHRARALQAAMGDLIQFAES